MLDFIPWPKIPRLHKEIVVSEKIDGTNAAVVIEKFGNGNASHPDLVARFLDPGTTDRTTISTFTGSGAKSSEDKYQAKLITRGEDVFLIAAQSRKRLITPESDNFGFARWVFDNADDLFTILGVGRHYGEWWGSGIQRGYGLDKGERRFSLFNVSKYAPLIAGHWDTYGDEVPALYNQIGTVPVLYQGPFSEQEIEDCMQNLEEHGSQVTPGFDNPEGIVVFHTAANQVFKWTFEDAAKGNSELTPDEYSKLAAGNVHATGQWLA